VKDRHVENLKVSRQSISNWSAVFICKILWFRSPEVYVSTSFSQCYGSEMFLPDPDFFSPSWIEHQQKRGGGEWGEQIYVVLPCFVAMNFTKSKTILLLTGTGKIWASWQLESRYLFPLKNCY
jgi:hypothetical protein